MHFCTMDNKVVCSSQWKPFCTTSCHDNSDTFIKLQRKSSFYTTVKLVPWLDNHQHLSLPVVAVMILHKKGFDKELIDFPLSKV